MSYKVGIVIPILNNFKGAVELIDSINTEESYKVYELDQWRHQDRPLSEAWNMGFDRAVADGCKYIFILNDDILFCRTSIDNAIKEYDRLTMGDGNVVMVSLNNVFGEYQGRENEFINWEQPYEVPHEVADHPNFSAFLVGPDFFDKCGRFDENFKPAWWEDNDMHYRIHLLGLRAICTVATSCVHFGGVSTALLPAERKTSNASSNYFGKKWGSANRNLDENYKTPYNIASLTPKDWIKDYSG